MKCEWKLSGDCDGDISNHTIKHEGKKVSVNICESHKKLHNQIMSVMENIARSVGYSEEEIEQQNNDYIMGNRYRLLIER